ncbi:MAG: SprB repeat-containing protein [Janthinobacterium lividum]
MPGERYSRLTIQAQLSHDDVQRGDETTRLDFALGSTTITLYRGGQPGEFIVPDPDDGAGEKYALQTVQNVVAQLRGRIFARSLPFEVSAPREAGTLPDYAGAPAPIPLVQFDITATSYGLGNDRALGFSFPHFAGYQPNWAIVENVAGISPVFATADSTNATIFGAADGAITINATGGSYPAPGAFFYTWSDGVTGATRTGLKAGTYLCTVRDQSTVANVTVKVVLTSDPELVVQVATTDTSITLTVSGGLPPYQYAWDDGSALPTRTGLSAGTYGCVVTDARGATKRIEVTLSAYHYNWSQNPITLALDAGDKYRADPTTKPNLSFLCEVWVELEYLSGDFAQVGTTLEQPADRTGRTVFQVQALLAAFLQHHVPAPASPDVVRADSLFRRYYLRHAEQFGEVPVPQPSLSLERNYVVLGGLSFYEASQATWFTDYQPRVQPFLTWEPTSKAVLDDQPEFLYFMVRKNPEAFRVQARARFTDGSEVVVGLGEQADVRDFEVYCLPVGYPALLAALGLAAAGKDVREWEVFVTTLDGLTGLSETRRFVRERRVFPHRRYFLFATSLGGMATYAALGEAVRDVEVTGTEASRTLAPDYDPQLGDTAVQARALRPVVKVAAGPRTRAQLEASQDLLLSRRVLLLAGPRWLPGFLKAKTSTLLDESKLVQVQEFDFYLTTERLYTPAL